MMRYSPIVMMLAAVIACLVFLTGCGSANTNSSSVVIIHDTVRVQVLSGEIRPVTGFPPTKRVEFNRIGQVGSFHQGEVVELIVSNIDMNQVTLQTETNPLTNEVTISTVAMEDARIVLHSKCDIIERRGISRIPSIEIDSNLDARKIVIVPIFNDAKECKVLGYQIRFDSAERDGCKEKINLALYNACTGKNTERPIKAKKTNCLEEILFGTPCPK